MDYYINALRQYADFKGRARRKEYWMFFLFQWIFLIVAICIDDVADTAMKGHFPYGLFYFLYLIPTFIPSLSVTVRRLHDVGKSAWLFFTLLIPLIGAIWFLGLLFSDGDEGCNKYGLNPKETSNI